MIILIYRHGIATAWLKHKRIGLVGVNWFGSVKLATLGNFQFYCVMSLMVKLTMQMCPIVYPLE